MAPNFDLKSFLASFDRFSSTASFQSLGSFPPRVWTQPYLSLKKLAKKGRKKDANGKGPSKNNKGGGYGTKKRKGIKMAAAGTQSNFYAIPLERRVQLVPELTNSQLPVLPHSFIPNIIGSTLNNHPINNQLISNPLMSTINNPLISTINNPLITSRSSPFLPQIPIFNSPPIAIPTVPRSVMIPRMDVQPFINTINHGPSAPLSGGFGNQFTGLSSTDGASTKFWWDKEMDIEEWNNKWNGKESNRRWDTTWSPKDQTWPSMTGEKWPSSVHSFNGNSFNGEKSIKQAPFDLLPEDQFSPLFIRK